MKALLSIGLLLLCLSAYAQNKKHTDTLTPQQEVEKMMAEWEPKHGNCKFKADIKFVRSFLVSANHSVKAFEQSLCYWDKDEVPDVRRFYSGDTLTATLFKLKYGTCTTKNSNYSGDGYDPLSQHVDIEYANDKVISIGFPLHEYAIEDKILPQLKSLGYNYAKENARKVNTVMRSAYDNPEMADQYAAYRSKLDKLFVTITYQGAKWYYVKIQTVK
jgi:hypothetical protein